MTCTNCGTENKADYKFCANCGSPLEVAEPDEGIRGGHRQKAVVQQPQEDSPSWGLLIASFFIPGYGHFKAGNTQKGALLLGGAVLLIATGLGYLIVAVYSAYDVYQNGGR